jgi:hypothetical protein
MKRRRYYVSGKYETPLWIATIVATVVAGVPIVTFMSLFIVPLWIN